MNDNTLEESAFSPEAVATLNAFNDYLDYINYLQDELLREDTDPETEEILMEDYKEAVKTLNSIKDDCKVIIRDAINTFNDLGIPVRFEYYKLLKTIEEFEKVNAHVLKNN